MSKYFLASVRLLNRVILSALRTSFCTPCVQNLMILTSTTILSSTNCACYSVSFPHFSQTSFEIVFILWIFCGESFFFLSPLFSSSVIIIAVPVRAGIGVGVGVTTIIRPWRGRVPVTVGGGRATLGHRILQAHSDTHSKRTTRAQDKWTK